MSGRPPGGCSSGRKEREGRGREEGGRGGKKRERGGRKREGGRGGEEGGRGGEEGGEGERREGEGERREEEGERAPSLSGPRFSPVDPGKRTRQRARPRASEFSRERLKARSLPPAVQGEQQFTLKSRVSASVISGESAVSGGLVLSPGTGPAVDLEIPFLETEGHEGWPEAKS